MVTCTYVQERGNVSASITVEDMPAIEALQSLQGRIESQRTGAG